MTPTKQNISEIAELLDCGHVCFFHKPTGRIEYYPDPEGEYFEPDSFQQIIDQIEADPDNYQRFVKMDSRQGFQVMEDFANSLTDSKFRDRLLELLSERKPFSKFKWAIDDSKYRQNWFDFKQQANIDWVYEQLG